VEDELARHKALKIPLAISTLLLICMEQSADYPILSIVARRVFYVPATSVQSERDFSFVERLTDARSQLSATKVESVELVRRGLRTGLLQ
jgi:hypothetical protein